MHRRRHHLRPHPPPPPTPHNQENPEEQQLHHQPQDNDALALLNLVGIEDVAGSARGEDAAAEQLHEEGDDVAADEDAGQPGAADGAERLGARGGDDAREDHVHGRGEEGGRDEDEEGLDDEGGAGVGVADGDVAREVADGFDCGGC